MNIETKVVLRFLRTASALEDVSHLRGQAVFLMGAGGSGKGFVGRKWMKYMPGAPSSGIDFNDPKHSQLLNQKFTEQERGLSNLNFEKAQADLAKQGIRLEAVGKDKGRINFRLYEYGPGNTEALIPESQWKEKLPPQVYQQVEGITEIVFSTPVYEIPSFWRQVNPDLYKEELAGYLESEPGYVHEMSSEMSKAYFSAILESGDPMFVDGTGSNLKKMANILSEAKAYGYQTSLIFVFVPLTVNQIRNATRSRNVNPNVITQQWNQISDVFAALRSRADVAKIIINRNDAQDAAKYKARSEEINNFIRKTTSYDDLYSLISKNAPNELNEWGRLLQTGSMHDPDRVDRFKRLEEKRKERGLLPRQFEAKFTYGR